MADTENSLVIFTRAATMLAEANTIQQAKELKSLALTAADWAKRKGIGEEAVQHARAYALLAERRMGELLQATERAKGTRGAGPGRGKKGNTNTVSPFSDAPTLTDLGISLNESSRAQKLANLPAETFQAVLDGTKTLADAKRETKRVEVAANLNNVASMKAKEIEGVYDVIVIDPPWPMKKIERDERPNQVEFDYPTMDESSLRLLEIPASDNCHVWLWTTHKFLPLAMSLLGTWELNYVCTFVWHKPGGFQPIGLPQYNCEFALYARRGSPMFLDTKALPVCFIAQRGKHSEKPEEFYSMVRRVTAGRRLDMFNRRKIDGFDGWGNESA